VPKHLRIRAWLALSPSPPRNDGCPSQICVAGGVPTNLPRPAGLGKVSNHSLKKFSRQCLLRWLAEPSGHGDFLEYFMHFNHPPEAVKKCPCGAVVSRGHFSPALLFLLTTHSREGGWALWSSGPPSNSSDLESPGPNSGGSPRTLPSDGSPSPHIHSFSPDPPRNPRAGHGSRNYSPTPQPCNMIALQYLTSVFSHAGFPPASPIIDIT